MLIKKVQPNSKEAFDFLLLAWRLYAKDERMQSTQEIEQLLTGSHPLSTTFSFQAFVGYENDSVVIRAALIQDKQSQLTYLGLFEAVNNLSVMAEFMQVINAEARKLGAKALVGPVNGSFWLGYRMKLSNFDTPPFTGEPHNLDYYPDLWRSVGFQLFEEYQSNYYVQSPLDYRADRLAKRYQQFVQAGYHFTHPSKAHWDTVSIEVFNLLSQLYADFPLYQPITSQQFSEIFASYRLILDFSMVTLAYFQGYLVGFLIPLPDYGTLVYQTLTPINTLRILRRRKKAKRYILLYLGADSNHLGLGAALSYQFFTQIKYRQAESIGALIHKGKITNNYAAEMQVKHTDYGLFRLELN
ncbi:hypothetical protein [Fundicoccus culcitae]|uniref:N-acetyltransferase domain-containing protein n=1 Tax=Fundicoccus culcitae TaxID=2969821 RepID=A0ABY5P7E3_9LACT|nr:hypothetical protein [Fundicoccus culcitae]UUX34658.1 hypothetical protein NRE15_03120 [Fundicoccus culcitae]